MLTSFDAFLIVFFLIIAALILGGLGMMLDNMLDPHCNCKEIRRQAAETRGVKL